jgi:lysozyme
MAARTLKRRLGFIALGAGALMALAGALYALVLHWRPSTTDYPLQGVDVSHHQGEIHWPSVRAEGAEFAYIKATEGADHRDTRFAENWRQSRAAGLRHGAYHFYTLCRLAADQATNFIATVPREADALPPAVDLEFGGNCAARPSRDVLIGELNTFLDMVESHAGKPAILYVTAEFEDSYAISRGLQRTLWLRRLFLPPNYGERPWVMWQASSIRRIEGVEGPVDWNVVRP